MLLDRDLPCLQVTGNQHIFESFVGFLEFCHNLLIGKISK